MAYCSVNGIRIYYEVSGEGFPLLLIHANPFDHRLWLYQIASFSTFFKVIAVDLRGYGHSDKPTSQTSLAMMAEDVLGVCWHQRGWQRGPSVGLGSSRDFQGLDPGWMQLWSKRAPDTDRRLREARHAD